MAFEILAGPEPTFFTRSLASAAKTACGWGVGWSLLVFGCLGLAGCLGGESGRDEVVVYSALDREFSQPILDAFSTETGVRVLPAYDVESTKTVGLVTRILQERARPRCDVFWNNEILHTLRLDKMGLLEVHIPPLAAGLPERCRSSRNTWFGFAARARVLLVNTDLIAEEDSPRSILDLATAKWKGKGAIARPLFGTSATHAAVLFAHWGDEKAQNYYRDVQKNAQVLAGNKQVALAVSQGRAAFGITDTDDAIIEVDKGLPVRIIYPDQQADGLGALFIPNTLCIIRGGPHPRAARRLVDYLLTPDVENRLAASASAQIPQHQDATGKSRALPEGVRVMRVDFEAAAEGWESAATFLRREFAGGA